MRTRPRLAAPATLVALLLTGCGTAAADLTRPDLRPVDDAEYVAMGDSYAAAPGVPETSTGCFRSDSNYAHLVAAAADYRLVDVTCSGATTDDVLAQQVESLSARTDLVTIGIGGNDGDLFNSLISGCLAIATDDPTGSPCTDRAADDVEALLPDIEDNIAGTLDAVVSAAPNARVVVVGYPDVVPESGTTCPDLIALATGDYELVRRVSLGLSDALRRQAVERDLEFVDVFTPSKGHDICSADPWINGAGIAPDGTIPFHPFASEQRAVATLIEQLLEER